MGVFLPLYRPLMLRRRAAIILFKARLPLPCQNKSGGSIESSSTHLHFYAVYRREYHSVRESASQSVHQRTPHLTSDLNLELLLYRATTAGVPLLHGRNVRVHPS